MNSKINWMKICENLFHLSEEFICTLWEIFLAQVRMNLNAYNLFKNCAAMETSI